MHFVRFFGFGGPAKKKSSTAAPPTLLAQVIVNCDCHDAILNFYH